MISRRRSPISLPPACCASRRSSGLSSGSSRRGSGSIAGASIISSRLLPRDTEAAAALAEHHDQRLAGRAWTRTEYRRELRHAIEIRHKSFLDPAFVALLRRHQLALVFAELGNLALCRGLTADFVYLRLHGSEELYASGYSDEALDHWAARIKLWARGLEPNDARLIAPDSPPPAQIPRRLCLFRQRRQGPRPGRRRSLRASWAEFPCRTGK